MSAADPPESESPRPTPADPPPSGVTAITGLRTFLGRRLAERLVPHGPVLGLDLHGPQGLPPSVELHEIDLTRPDAATGLVDVLAKRDVQTVVHLAFRRRPTADLEADHELDVLGTVHLLGACAAAGIRRLVVGSTTMVYGARADNPNHLRESHPLRGHPHAHAVQNRVEVEELVARFATERPGTVVTVLRPCWIVGPTYRDPIVDYLARPWVPVLLGYDPLLQLVHEDDCLHAFERAAREQHPGAFNVVAPGVLPLSALIRGAGQRVLQVPPAWIHRLRAFPSQAQSGDRPEGFYDYLRYLWVADGEKGFRAFGPPSYDTREAWMSFVSARRMRRYL